MGLILWNVVRLHFKFGPRVSREIYGWQQSHYLENVDTDRESRTFNHNTEWSLNSNIFHSIVETYGMPSIDHFTSRIMSLLLLVSRNFFGFPPFSLILRCLKKIEMEEVEGIIIVVVWPTQTWFPKLMSRLVEPPRLLPVIRGTLYLPSKPVNHILCRANWN